MSRLEPKRGVSFALLAAMILLLTAAPAGASYRLVDKWGSAGDGEGQFHGPSGIATDSQDHVYVVDSRNDRIEKFDHFGTFIGQWGSAGSEDGQFSNPSGIAIDSKDNVYVADTNTAQIQKFDSSGNFVTSWELGSLPYTFVGGIATDSRDDVYAAIFQFSSCYRCSPEAVAQVQKFDPLGNFAGAWGSYGQFGIPGGVAIDSEDNVYVVDPASSTIQKFDAAGHHLTSWGSRAGGGQLDPFAIATDPQDNVYVADPGNGQVNKFDSSGTFLTRLGSGGPGDAPLPGIATDSKDSVYVTEYDNNWIRKFTEVRPRTTITRGPPDRTKDNTPTIGFSSDRPNARFECRFDSQAFAPCQSPLYADPLPDGRHRFEVRAIDNEGSIDSSPANRDLLLVPGIEGSASARGTQVHVGKTLRIRAKAKARERLVVRATGKIKINPTYRLKPRTVKLAEGKSKTLRLVPKKRKSAKRIAKAFREGKKAKAKLKVQLTDDVGNNKETEKLSVKLKR